MQRPKAAELVEAARTALMLPGTLAAVHARVLARDVELLDRLESPGPRRGWPRCCP